METIIMKLRPKYHEEIEIILQEEKKSDYFDIPIGKEVVYNDNPYLFCLPDAAVLPSKVFVNDEAYGAELYEKTSDALIFGLKDCTLPFFESFGAIKIEIELDGKQYCSKSISVMISNTDVNNGVLNMIEYIYANSDNYLYEEHKNSSIISGIKKNETISLEAKIAFLQKTLNVYKQSYQYLKSNPYAKLEKTERVDSFDKLQSISQRTIHYIANNIDELTVVNYNTGIRFNNQYYQPNRILVECNSYSLDVYENQVIIGFIKTLVSDINIIIKSLLERSYLKSKAPINGYIDSMYQIFTRSIKKIKGYVEELKSLQSDYQQLYYFYSKLFNISAEMIGSLPVFTPVFRSINAYRQIYEAIHDWFSLGNYDLGKDELLLSFISTSNIYEYYCLIKMLCYINSNTDIKLVESKRATYSVNHPNFNNTRYNNTFIFENDNIKLTLYFQPVIYGDDKAFNGISLFRNTSSNSKEDNNSRGRIYNPDYIIKAEQDNKIDYILLDAKFSTTKNVRLNQLQELVYKYLFSISTLDSSARLKGLYILCGKTLGNDSQDVVHDLAKKLNRAVNPFAEILVMNGVDTEDYSMVTEIIKQLQYGRST